MRLDPSNLMDNLYSLKNVLKTYFSVFFLKMQSRATSLASIFRKILEIDKFPCNFLKIRLFH
jgi:hypothetical protein